MVGYQEAQPPRYIREGDLNYVVVRGDSLNSDDHDILVMAFVISAAAELRGGGDVRTRLVVKGGLSED